LTIDQENPKGEFFKLGQKSLFQRAILEFLHSLENFDLADAIVGLLPLGLMNVPGSIDNKVSTALSHELDSLEIILLNELSKVSADDLSVHIKLIFRDIWDLEHKRGGHVDTVKKVEINLQVRWDLSLFLLHLFVLGLFLLSVEATALSKRLFDLGALANLHESLICFDEVA